MGLRDRTPVIEDMLLARLAAHPHGDPDLTVHTYMDRLVERGWVVRDVDGTPSLTQDGWCAMAPRHQTRIWHAAVTEHAQRQGPADAETVRRLVLEEAWEWAAFRRLAAQGQPAAADQCAYQATLIKARLAVLVGVPVGEMDEVTVVLRAEALAEMLERLTAEDPPHVWAMDPWRRVNGVQPCRNGGGLRRWRREVSAEADWQAALLES